MPRIFHREFRTSSLHRSLLVRSPGRPMAALNADWNNDESWIFSSHSPSSMPCFCREDFPMEDGTVASRMQVSESETARP